MKNFIKIVSLLVLFTAVQSCTDLLTQPEPSTSTVQEIALGTPSGVKSLRANMYSILFSFYYTTEYMIAPSTLADDLSTRLGANRYEGKASNAPGSTVAGSSTGATAAGEVSAAQYITGYSLINQANLIIEAIEPGVIPDDLLRQYRGEAFMLRAFAMHHLVRALAYEPGVTPNFGQGQGFDLGIIIRTEPVLTPNEADFLPRSTVTEVYQQIESDLLQSIDLLSQGDADSPNYVTKAAAEGLLARVYLYWRKYDLADQYATAAIQNSPARLAQPNEVGTLFDAGTSIEVIFRAFVQNPSSEGSGSLANYTSILFIAQVPTQDLMDIYSDNDSRLAWFAPCFNDLQGAPMGGCLATHPAIAGGSEELELQKWNADIGNEADHIPFFRIAEMVLIQAEARLKQGNVAGAVTKLDKLRASRGLQPYAGTITADAVMQAILLERRREFVGEGHRFFDMKRLGMAIPKAYDIPNVSPVPFADRRILAIVPVSEVALAQSAVERGVIPADSALTQNPGY